MKQVRKTQAGKAISCYVVLKDGKIVATVHSHYSKSGLCTVDVWEKSLVHQGRAGGYGYDKFTAALSGAVICGVKIYDHCVPVPLGSEDMKAIATHGKAKAIGAQWANLDADLFYASGLERLRMFGFTVEQVL